jgi:hypothetical protein
MSEKSIGTRIFLRFKICGTISVTPSDSVTCAFIYLNFDALSMDGSAAVAESCAFLALRSGELWAVLSKFLRANRADTSQPEQQMTQKNVTRVEHLGYAPDKLNR